MYYMRIDVIILLIFIVRWPHNVNFSAPETEELFGTRNLYLTPEEGISIGVW